MADSTYFVSVRESAVAAGKRHLTLWNGTASQNLRVLCVQASGAPTAAVAGLIVPLYVARITTQPTGGSALTVVKANPTNPNVPATIEAQTGATSGGTEEASAFGVGTVSGEETAFLGNQVLYQMQLNGAQPMILAPGTGLVVRQGTLASAGNISVVVQVSVR